MKISFIAVKQMKNVQNVNMKNIQAQIIDAQFQKIVQNPKKEYVLNVKMGFIWVQITIALMFKDASTQITMNAQNVKVVIIMIEV